MLELFYDLRVFIPVSWLVILIARIVLNIQVFIKKYHSLSPEEKLGKDYPGGIALGLIRLHNPLSTGDSPSLVILKKWANTINFSFVFATGILIISMFSIILYETENGYDSKTNNDYTYYSKPDCKEDNANQPFGKKYNKVREEKGLVLMPEDFCLSDNGSTNTQLWINPSATGSRYYYDSKYVYLDDSGAWAGEYDLFYHKEKGRLDETLNCDFKLIDGNIERVFRHNSKIITENEFKKLMEEWGLAFY